MLEVGRGNAKILDSYDSLALAQNDKVIDFLTLLRVTEEKFSCWKNEVGGGTAKILDSYDSLVLAQNDKVHLDSSAGSE